MVKKEQEREEHLGLCKKTEQAPVGRASTEVWKTRREKKRRTDPGKEWRPCSAYLFPKLLGRERESKEKGRGFAPGLGEQEGTGGRWLTDRTHQERQ